MSRMFENRQLKFAVVGVGFWASPQLHSWQTLSEVSCIAICDKNEQKAQNLAKELKIPQHYSDVTKLLNDQPNLDFIDIITDPPSHFEVIETNHVNCPPIIIVPYLNYDNRARA